MKKEKKDLLSSALLTTSNPVLFLQRYYKKRRSYSYLLINLMISDLVILITNLPIVVYNSIHRKWMFGQQGEYSMC